MGQPAECLQALGIQQGTHGNGETFLFRLCRQVEDYLTLSPVCTILCKGLQLYITCLAGYIIWCADLAMQSYEEQTADGIGHIGVRE